MTVFFCSNNDEEETILSTIDNVRSVDQSFIESLEDEDMKDSTVTMTEAENTVPDTSNQKSKFYSSRV